MKESKLNYLSAPLKEMVYQYETVLKGFKEKNNIKAAALTCEILPIEILASFGILPLRIPSFIGNDGCYSKDALMDIELNEIYDLLIVPGKCDNKSRFMNLSIPYYEFNNPSGWGEEASIRLHNGIDALLKSAGISEIKHLDIKRLQEVTEQYNIVKRLIRGISSIRKTKPDLLSNQDLTVIFEAAAIFPPQVVIEYLVKIRDALNENRSEYDGNLIQSLVYPGLFSNGLLLDEIEEAGCLISEDDSCNGRRQFDTSYNSSSEYLYYEILDAFSYKPLCPMKRPDNERYELLYKLLKNHDIELVIFNEDTCCKMRKREIRNLRIKLMMSGIDPVIVNSGNAYDKIKEYTNRCREINRL